MKKPKRDWLGELIERVVTGNDWTDNVELFQYAHELRVMMAAGSDYRDPTLHGRYHSQRKSKKRAHRTHFKD